ncbi:conserved hypothetical protein [Onion yellows phytoplasma OY-M]|uniref:Uncharacterized protein n=1 Tax=Onion yellows phytoplasma (strain OY-M) TaxID=262768 RepID=Q6YQG2_ONYPE|nr:conserved hypothetical protein [Onion yellows phytoplasma OY-M]
MIEGFEVLEMKINNDDFVNFDKVTNLTQILFNSKKLSEEKITNYRKNIKTIIEKLCLYFETNLIYLTNENFEIGEYGFESIKNKISLNFPNNKFLIFLECENNDVSQKGFYSKLTWQVLKIFNEVEYKINDFEINFIVSTDDIKLIDSNIRAKFCHNEISPNKNSLI